MEILYLLAAIAWVAVAYYVAKFAERKGHSFMVSLLVGLFLSAISQIIIALIMEDKSEELGINSGELRKCPYCAEIVKAEAKICKHCGKELPELEKKQVNKTIPKSPAGHTGYCEKCGVKTSINYGDAYHTLCKNCS